MKQCILKLKKEIIKLQNRLDENKARMIDSVNDNSFWHVSKLSTEASMILGKIEALRDVVQQYEYYNK